MNAPLSDKPKRRRVSSQRKTSPALERLRQILSTRRDPDEEQVFRSIAAQVTQRRHDWNLSQAELAELCGTTQSAIARVERGSRPPRVDTLLGIAAALDCELVVELRPRTRSAGSGDDADRVVAAIERKAG